MAPAKAVFTRETFQFFKDLARHNHKEWMDAHRDRYQSALVQPLRRLLEELAPAALELDPRFDTTGRTGANFSRINRDIRFAKDKSAKSPHWRWSPNRAWPRSPAGLRSRRSASDVAMKATGTQW